MSVDRPQGLVEDSGRLGESRKLGQMISARLDPTLVAALKQFAKHNGLTLSDVIRDAALLLLAREDAQNVIIVHVDVTNERSALSANTSFRQHIPVAI